MSDFPSALGLLVRPLDPTKHASEITRLQGCRSLRDLEHLAADRGGWLSPERPGKRLKLVRHGSGTYLVVEYDDGWSTALSRQGFSR